MTDKQLINTAWSLLNLLLGAGLGCYIGTVFEYRNWTRFASFLAKPMIKFGRLPDVCGTAFLTSFVSSNAANSMIAGAYSDKKITRAQLIIAGISNSFPNKLSHLLRVIYLIPILGLAGLLYFAIQIMSGFFRTLLVLLYSRALHGSIENINVEDLKIVSQNRKVVLTWKETFKKAEERTKKLLIKVISIAAPVYLFVAWLIASGYLVNIDKVVPECLKYFFPSEVISVMVARIGSLAGSAQVASTLLGEMKITVYQVLIAFFVGNVLTTPIRTLRRNIPSAIGIFPVRDGWIIVLTVQLFRVLSALFVITGLMIYIRYF